MIQLPENEAERLLALLSYGVLDTDFEDSYDRITRMAAKMFDVPVSLVSLLDQKRQWFKSACGLGVRETPREVAFCNLTIRQSEILVVPDARKSPLFRDNPLVKGPPHVIFYAGAPIVNPQGHALGSVCIIDHVPREDFNVRQLEMLKDFAGLVVDLLENRRRIARLEQELDPAIGAEIMARAASPVTRVASF